jgi:hypothetical protein
MVQDAHEYLAAGATFVQTEVVVITVITLASFFFYLSPGSNHGAQENCRAVGSHHSAEGYQWFVAFQNVGKHVLSKTLIICNLKEQASCIHHQSIFKHRKISISLMK